MTFSRVSIIVVITAVLVYFGLNLLLPRNQKEKAPSTGVTAEQVFNGEPAPADSTAAAPTDTAAATAEPALPTTEPAATPAETADSQGLSDEEARKIAENVSREVANRVVETSGAAAAPAPAEEPAPPPSTAEPTPAAAPAPSADVAAAPTVDTQPVAETASAPKPVARKKSASKPSSSPGSDVISSWWPATDKQIPDRLNLVFAGQAASEKSVVLLFSSAIGDATQASSKIQLLSVDGAAVNGAWTAGNNPRLLVFKGLKPGRYTVLLKPELADAGGKTLGSELHGPVYVR